MVCQGSFWLPKEIKRNTQTVLGAATCGYGSLSLLARKLSLGLASNAHMDVFAKDKFGIVKFDVFTKNSKPKTAFFGNG